MRLRLEDKGKDAPSGPSQFMRRLADALRADPSIRLVDDSPEVSLGTIRLPPERGGKRAVRIDGAYYNLATHSRKSNRPIAEAIAKADGIIYQSHFSKRLCESLCRAQARRSVVIPNGIDQAALSAIPPRQKEASTVFVASANWRTSKRPASIISGFLEASIPDSCLLMLGAYKDARPYPNVHYLGNLRAREVIAALRSATAFIHLAYLESCPNAVVEALSLGLPVVCNNIGGTSELVQDCGIVLPCDEPFPFAYVNKPNVDHLPPALIAQGLRDCVARSWNIQRPDLDIGVTARAYADFLRSL